MWSGSSVHTLTMRHKSASGCAKSCSLEPLDCDVWADWPKSSFRKSLRGKSLGQFRCGFDSRRLHFAESVTGSNYTIPIGQGGGFANDDRVCARGSYHSGGESASAP
jgi:hypothetical protein